MRDKAGPGASDSEDDLANAYRIGRECHGRETASFDVKKRQVRAGVASDDASRDFAVGGACTDLFIGIEQMIRDEKRLWIDDRAAGGSTTSTAQEHETWSGSGCGFCQISGELLSK
jgi:hypothetical protein